VSVSRDGDVVTFGFRANAFLHQMVRTVMGTLVRVGEGKLEPDDVRTMLEARQRAVISQPAPAQGLTLVRVAYGSRPGTGERR
jgi:tRNA pseudouridine38-40 synthase